VLRGTLLPYFAKMQMKDVSTLTLQLFVNRCTQSSKTRSNFIGLLRMMWKIAKAWGYVTHDPFEGLVLPKHQARAPFFFTVDEVKLILVAADLPNKTLYWMAAETGMRPGELAGLRLEDVNLEGLSVRVVQSVYGQENSKRRRMQMRFGSWPFLQSWQGTCGYTCRLGARIH
jgi:integrase